MKKTTALKNLITAAPILKMPCAHDALSARVIETVGFDAMCVAGYGASASLLGRPDISLLSMTEMADQVRRISEAVDLPILTDGDTGYGGALNVARTVRTFEQAGAAGIFIEDQVFPKRCGHMAGKDVVSRQEMLARIHAAVDARNDDDFVIMGRTDALAVHGLDEAIERGQLLHEAGCDIIFVEAPTSTEQMRRINREIPGPNFIAYIEGGKIPLLPAHEFEDLGYDVVAYGCSSVYAAAHAFMKMFQEIKETGATVEAQKEMIPFGEFNELLGLADIRKKEAQYAGKEKE